MIRLMFPLAVLAILLPTARAQEPGEDAKTFAEQILDKGARSFGNKDSKAMAAFFTEDAELVLTNRTKGETKTEARHGRMAIEEFYRELFNGNYKDTFQGIEVLKPKNTVEHARFLDREMMLICGFFEPNTDQTLKVPFVQIRVKRADQWLMSHVRIFAISKEK